MEQSTSEEIKEQPKIDLPEAEKKSKTKTIVAVIVLVIIVAPITTFLLGVYKFHWQGNTVDKVMAATHLPIASVNGHWIGYTEWRKGVDATNHFYSKKDELQLQTSIPALTPEQIQANELARLIEKELLQELADQYTIQVTQDDIDSEYTATILPQAAGGEEEIQKTIDTLYGWTLDQFKAEVVKEVVLRQKLQTAMNSDVTLNATAKQKIEAAKAELDAGKDFADIAKQYSEDSSAKDGGDLSWIEKGQTVPEFETTAFATAVGSISDIFTSQYGYHILKVLEKDDTRVHVAHILTKFVNIDDQVATLKAAAKISKFISLPESN